MAKQLASLWLALAFAVVACGAPARPDAQSQSPQAAALPTAPKRIVAAFLSDPPALQNRVNSAVAGGRTSAGVRELENLLNAGLTMAQDRGVLYPRLAEAVPTLENGLWRVLPDGSTETTWRIKQGVQWHDGAPFTAEDLVFSAQVAQDRELPFVRELGYDLIERVEVVDPRTVTVKWKRPYIEADALFGGGELVPKHLLERAYAEDKASFAHQPYWTTEFIGLGPYRLREFVRNSHMVLEANDRYVLGRPRIDEIEIKFRPDPNTLAANILAGAVELTIGQTFSLETALRVAGDPNNREWDDIEASIVRYGFDPRRATQLIEGLGYTKGADGFFRDPAGQRLSVELRTLASFD